MRIYVPLLPDDEAGLSATGALPGRLALAADRPAWAVTPEARADRPGEDPEDLEYDAMQDAVYAALEGSAGTAGGASAKRVTGDRRVGILAGDVPDTALAAASATGGAFGVVLTAPAELRIASAHVTELGADAARADDTDPALLWFDVAETAEALSFLREPYRRERA